MVKEIADPTFNIEEKLREIAKGEEEIDESLNNLQTIRETDKAEMLRIANEHN